MRNYVSAATCTHRGRIKLCNEVPDRNTDHYHCTGNGKVFRRMGKEFVIGKVLIVSRTINNFHAHINIWEIAMQASLYEELKSTRRE